MSVRCKLKLVEISEVADFGIARKLKFEAKYDYRFPEDERIRETTPRAIFEMECNDVHALTRFQLGRAYYFDIIEADPPKS